MTVGYRIAGLGIIMYQKRTIIRTIGLPRREQWPHYNYYVKLGTDYEAGWTLNDIVVVYYYKAEGLRVKQELDIILSNIIRIRIVPVRTTYNKARVKHINIQAYKHT